jgi:hypothetical protein
LPCELFSVAWIGGLQGDAVGLVVWDGAVGQRCERYIGHANGPQRHMSVAVQLEPCGAGEIGELPAKRGKYDEIRGGCLAVRGGLDAGEDELQIIDAAIGMLDTMDREERIDGCLCHEVSAGTRAELPGLR